MQSTNTGILKPALWHTPAITKDGLIRQAPDPQENHEGFVSRSLVGVKTRSSPTQLRRAQTCTITHGPTRCTGVGRRSGRGYLRCAEGGTRGRTCDERLSAAALALAALKPSPASREPTIIPL